MGVYDRKDMYAESKCTVPLKSMHDHGCKIIEDYDILQISQMQYEITRYYERNEDICGKIMRSKYFTRMMEKLGYKQE